MRETERAWDSNDHRSRTIHVVRVHRRKHRWHHHFVVVIFTFSRLICAFETLTVKSALLSCTPADHQQPAHLSTTAAPGVLAIKTPLLQPVAAGLCRVVLMLHQTLPSVFPVRGPQPVFISLHLQSQPHPPLHPTPTTKMAAGHLLFLPPSNAACENKSCSSSQSAVGSKSCRCF